MARLSGLALLSTFAGNLLLTGSLCNIIVAERPQASGARSSFVDFARSGIPMTLASLAVAGLWLWAMAICRCNCGLITRLALTQDLC